MSCRLICPSIGVHLPALLIIFVAGLMVLVHSNIQTVSSSIIGLHQNARPFVLACSVSAGHIVLIQSRPRGVTKNCTTSKTELLAIMNGGFQQSFIITKGSILDVVEFLDVLKYNEHSKWTYEEDQQHALQRTTTNYENL